MRGIAKRCHKGFFPVHRELFGIETGGQQFCNLQTAADRKMRATRNFMMRYEV